MQLTAFDSAGTFLEIAQPFLQAQESQNSLLLGLALRARAGEEVCDEGTRYFVLQADAEVRGAVMQTPGRAPVFTAMSAEAALLAATELPAHLDSLVGCLGPAEVVDQVAAAWTVAELGQLELHSNMRLFELTKLTAARPAEGRMRLATERDFELCQRWLYRFMIDCHLPEATPGELPERVPHLEQKRLYLWEARGQPVACAAWSRPTSEGISIGYVYTPDEERGHGYASNVVSALTAGLLDGSLYQPARKRVNLFTDLTNPTSNSIYRKLGYQPIGDYRHYLFAQ